MNSNESNNTENNSEGIIAKGGNRQMGPVAENSEDSSSTARPTPPTNTDRSEMQMGTPPEMDCDIEDESCEMPEPPEGFDGEMPSEITGGFGGGRGSFTTQDANSNPDAVWHPVAYLAIGASSVILSILISYACFSRCFHLRPGETFSKLSKFMWFVLVAVVLTIGLCVLGFFIPKWTS